MPLSRRPGWTLSLIGLLCSVASAQDFVVTPGQISLSGNLDRSQLVVTASDAAGASDVRSADLTPKAEFVTTDPRVVSVSPSGQVLALANGQAAIQVKVGTAVKEIPVLVNDVVEHPVIGFDQTVMPIIAKAGCNMGACHASQYGKGGFVLSVFGFDPPKDWQNIVRDLQQRRVSFIHPEDSLLLKKPTTEIPHGGGRRLEKDSVDYKLLAQWLAGGASKPDDKAAKVAKVEVFPPHRVGEIGMQQQLRVVATYSDGKVRDVTHWAKFDSLDDATVNVTPAGRYTTLGRGQAPVMVRFEGQAAISMVVVPASTPADLATWTPHNFIDTYAKDKFAEIGITPSGLCDDATFVRRVYLDAIGTLPTPAEAAAFVDDADPEKRRKLIDLLLGFSPDGRNPYNDQYAAFWALKWSDLIRTDSRELGEQGMWAIHNWTQESFRKNKRFDAFVKELVMGKGSVFSNGPANYYRVANNPPDLAETTAQLFLGVRLQCAKCHHHPFEKYGQEDYYAFAAFFARVGSKSSQEFGLFGGESVVLVRSGGEVSHPRTGKILPPTPLEGAPVDDPLDRRIALAKWLTAPENRMFARNVVNRYMGYVMGHGLVEEIDDMRATNPPSNPALLDALADDFVKSGFNLKHLMRTIMNSRLYQLDSQPTEANATDRKFFSHYKVKRLQAEVLLDALDQVTGTQTKFKQLPLGTRAIELPDAEYPDYFLTTFAKPKRASVCECERTPDPNLTQALHTLNGDIVANKVADPNGRIAKLLAANKPHLEIVTELYLVTLGRRPSPAEVAASDQFLATSPSPKECYEDLLWALINSKQFLFVH